MTQQADRPRPRRADVADSYDRGAAAYEALWSPVILPPAAALVQYLGLTGRCVVADVGAVEGEERFVHGVDRISARVMSCPFARARSSQDSASSRVLSRACCRPAA